MKIFDNISLLPYNTFGIDVPARRMVEIESADDAALLTDPTFQLLPYLILGGGSNVVFCSPYDGTVVRLATRDEAVVEEDRVHVSAWGGMVMDRLVEWCIERGLYGLENLSAIPGTVGASAVQNVGAYGAEAKDVIERVEAYDLAEKRYVTFAASECHFGYRHSLFKEHPGRWLVLRVVYRLQREFSPNLLYKALADADASTARTLRQAIIDLRWSKLPRPEEHGSAGSFFKNPVVEADVYARLKAAYPDMPDAHAADGGYKLSAGWLIDRAGWKGRTMGRAGVWPRQALVLYNTGACTGSEVQSLATAIQADVQGRFGVTLVPEAVMVGGVRIEN